MPRLITSSVSSRGVQCVTGRPEFSGGSHATARIWAICSAVNVPPQPARGKSPRASAIAPRRAAGFSTHSITTSRGKACCHRRRQAPTPCRSQPSRAAIPSFLTPANASKMISARWANPCGHDRAQTIDWSTACCRSVITTLAAIPGMTSPPQGTLQGAEKMAKIVHGWKADSAQVN